MLTRLKVKGFKNLVDLEVRFGPFTCIAGLNGIGKSNLFDAILFLSKLADSTLLEAMTGVRGETRSADALRIFSRWPGGSAQEMYFEVDMLVRPEVHDDLDQVARATTTALKYTIGLKATPEDGTVIPRLEVTEERLAYYRKQDLEEMLPFAGGAEYRAWRDSVVSGVRRGSPFISTHREDGNAFVRVHEDSGHQGRARRIRANSLQRTVLSSMNTSENPTALAARREMQSWRLLQLEPSRLRAPDEMKAHGHLGADGQGLAATLNRLLKQGNTDEQEARRSRLVGRLRELNEDVRHIGVDADEKRELLTVLVENQSGLEFRARDLSDGTLRFLALAVMQEDPAWGGVVCMEEPENGIHPTRVRSMLALLQELAVDLKYTTDDNNPLRQVIVNTHSPEVVGLVPEGSLLIAERVPVSDGLHVKSLALRGLPGTWRSKLPGARVVGTGELNEFLNALGVALGDAPDDGDGFRVAQRAELRQLLFPFESGRIQ